MGIWSKLVDDILALHENNMVPLSNVEIRLGKGDSIHYPFFEQCLGG